MSALVDWKRLEKFVFQECRREGHTDGGMVMEKLRGIVTLCGGEIHGRQEINRVALSLVKTNCAPLVIAPCCPDYTHKDGKYTFQGLRGGVSLLTSLHLQFLEPLSEVLPEARVKILIADQEADDEALCRVCGKTREEFLNLVSESIAQTQHAVNHKAWEARAFTEYVPDLLTQESAIAEKLLSVPMFADRLRRETWSREDMYGRIGTFTPAQMLKRTARTAAQYLALGRLVQSESGILVNHTTTNLKWYAETEVAVLHNPVCVY